MDVTNIAHIGPVEAFVLLVAVAGVGALVARAIARTARRPR